MFGNVRQAFGTILENLRKFSESGRKPSENRQKRRPILAVLGIFFIRLFPNWTACSPITYTNCCPSMESIVRN